MNAALHENTMRCYRRVYKSRKTVEVTGETVVPDTLPDIGIIGETTMHPLVRSKRAALGLVAMEGELEAAVSYLSEEEDGFSVLHLTLPWLGEFTGEALQDTTVVQGDVQVKLMETRLLNPRKLLVKAQLEVEVTCYEPDSLHYWEEAPHDGLVQVQQERVTGSLVGTVCEHSFVVTDEYPLSGRLEHGQLLHHRVSFRLEDVKTIANKLIVRGLAQTDAVLSGSDGEVETVSFSSGFSFIAETDCEQVTEDVLCQMFATGMYYSVSEDGRSLSAEVHGVCQMAVYVERELEIVTDAYSNLCACQLNRAELELLSAHESGPRRETLTASLPCPVPLQKLKLLTVSPLAPQKTGDGVQLPLQLSACVAGESGERLWPKQTAYVQLQLEPDQWVNAVTVLDASGSVSGTELTVHVTVEAEICRESWEKRSMVCEISCDEETPSGADRPSLTVVRTGGSLWALAKTYGSSVELIRQYNGLSEEEAAPDTLLLIPKQAKR